MGGPHEIARRRVNGSCRRCGRAVFARRQAYLCLRSSRCSSDTTTAKAIMISAVAICAPVMMSVRLFIVRMLLKDISNV